MIGGAAIACLLWSLGPATTAQAQASFPERLDDAAFRRLLTELSEADGFFADENFVSNELGLVRLLPALNAQFEPGGVYLGVGPEQNFTYIATLDPAIAFIVDIRRQNLLEHLMYKALFEISSDRREFLQRLFSRPVGRDLGDDATSDALLRALRVTPADPVLAATTLASIFERLSIAHGLELDDSDRAAIGKIFAAFHEQGPAIAYTFRETDDWHPNFVQLMDVSDAAGRNWSFLGSDANYERVRRMQVDNLVIPVVGDFAGPETLRAIGSYVAGLGGTVDVFYVSNVESYLFADGIAAAFYENVAALPVSEASIMIRTFFGSTARACPESVPVLRAPLSDSIVDLVAAFRRGALTSVCALADRSR